MKKVVLSVVAALAVSAAAPAFAADMPAKAPSVAPVPPPSPWDIAFGSALMTDYIFRGVTQSAHHPSVAAYVEPRYNINSNWQLYAGISGESIKFANNAAAEGDCYGGGVLGPPDPACLAAFPNGNVAKSVASFYEVYGKATYTWTDWAFGANFYWSPNFLNLGADGEYLSGTIKFTAPEKMALGPFGWYVSGEFGRQWLGTSDAFYGNGIYPNGIPEPSYNTWNVGLGFTWKVFTLDLRYSDTDLSKAECNAFTSDPRAPLSASFVTPINQGLGTVAGGSNWCGARFVAKLSADLTLGSLK